MQLTSGEVGLVVSVNPDLRLRAKVKVLLDSYKSPYAQPGSIDLAANFRANPDTAYAIETVLMPGAYGIALSEHLYRSGGDQTATGQSDSAMTAG